MTQVHSLSSPMSRLARAVENTGLNQRGKVRWEPSREEMLRMRQMSRKNFSCHEAYESIKPPVGPQAFRERAHSLGILYSSFPGSWRGKRL